MNDNTLITIPGPLAVEILEATFPRKKQSETPVEDLHMYLFGHTKNIVKPIDHAQQRNIQK